MVCVVSLPRSWTRVWISSQLCSPFFENQLPLLPFRTECISAHCGWHHWQEEISSPSDPQACLGEVNMSKILSQMNQGIKEIGIFIPHCRTLDIFLMPFLRHQVFLLASGLWFIFYISVCLRHASDGFWIFLPQGSFI